MWTYQQKHTPVIPRSAPIAKPEAPRIPTASSRDVSLLWLLAFAGSYLAGEAWGSLLCQKLSSGPLVYLQYYYENILSLCREDQFPLLFGTRFLSLFVLFTAVLLMGLCTFGLPALFALAFLKGAATGSFLIQLLLEEGRQGMLSAILLFWPVEALAAVLSLYLFRAASRSSLALWRTSRGARPVSLQALQNRLMRVYLLNSILAILPCGLAVLLCQIFGFLLD